MTMRRLRIVLLAVALGAIPMGTVTSCDYSDGYGSFVYDRGDGVAFRPGWGGGVIVVEDEYVIDYYEEDCAVWDGCFWDDLW